VKIEFSEFVFDLDINLRVKFINKGSNPTETKVLDLISKWIRGDQSFLFKTSGSTGQPKFINISRDRIEYSVRQTISFLDRNHNFKNSLLCINPEFIGGAMVVFRSLICNLDLKVAEPKNDLSTYLDKSFDLVSIVPSQFFNTPPEFISKCKTILIGGGPMPILKQSFDNSIYSTYGMTETVSNIALRKLNEEYFKTIGDVQIDSTDHCLRIKGTITEGSWIQTNDIVEIVNQTSFIWKGRADFIINSGGIKYSPENIESQINGLQKGTFVISSKKDQLLGEKIVLVTNSKSRISPDYSLLTKYEKPKEIIYVRSLDMLKSHKPNRKLIKERINES